MKEVRREVAVGADGALQIMVVGIVLKEADRKIYDICDNKLAAKIDLLEVNCEVEDVVVAIDREVEVIGLEHVLDDGLVDVLQEVAREACAHETGLNKESVDEDGLVQKVLDEAVNVILEKVREQGLRMLRLHSSEEDAKCCYCTSVVGRGTKSVCSVFTLPYNQMRNVSTSAVHSRTGVVRRRTRTHTSILPIIYVALDVPDRRTGVVRRRSRYEVSLHAYSHFHTTNHLCDLSLQGTAFYRGHAMEGGPLSPPQRHDMSSNGVHACAVLVIT